jgi:hypothetical protein
MPAAAINSGYTKQAQGGTCARLRECLDFCISGGGALLMAWRATRRVAVDGWRKIYQRK